MLVLVAVGAVVEFQFEDCICAARDVALSAGSFGMGTLERVSRLRVICDSESRWFPAVNRMATGTLAAIRKLGELPFVRVRLVAISALGEDDRFLEISTAVALNTAHSGMFPEQWELGS
jgi:hypothetical protein